MKTRIYNAGIRVSLDSNFIRRLMQREIRSCQALKMHILILL